ncbi:ATP-binding protein [Streptomyces nigrescens]
MPSRDSLPLSPNPWVRPETSSSAPSPPGAWGLEGRDEDIRLCVSELATNALTHGTPCGQGFHVTMSAEDTIVRIEVHDAAPHWPRPRRSTDDDTSGRGLHIVDMLSDDWGVEDRGVAGKVVWSRFKAAPTIQEAPC